MASSDRGVLYVVWGTGVDDHVNRSVASLKLHHPDIPVEIARVEPQDPSRGLREKARMAKLTPFKTTLFLDADTTVMGNLDRAFEQAERFGIACCICESPWARRYDHRLRDALEYNTGVIFFSDSAKHVFDAWDRLADTEPAASKWTRVDGKIRGMPFEDQASFAAAIRECDFNPSVLPLNYNFRPEYHRSAFLPLKIWHDYIPPPESLKRLSLACERGEREVTYLTFTVQNPSQPPPYRSGGK